MDIATQNCIAAHHLVIQSFAESVMQYVHMIAIFSDLQPRPIDPFYSVDPNLTQISQAGIS